MSALVDWQLAERIAVAVAGAEAETPDPADLREAGADAVERVVAYTGLEPVEPVPDPEWVSRREWARVAISSFRDALDPLSERLGEGLGVPGPAGAAMRSALGKVAGAEAGAVAGYASRRVLGQYEIPILGPEREPRLLFVAANVESAREALGADRDALVHWIALHEVTHAVHFGSVPWLRSHLGGLASELLEEGRLGPGPGELAAAARRLASTDPRRTLASLRASDPLRLITPASSRPTIDSIQATMAMVEGFAEHVMDAAAGDLGPEVVRLRAGMDSRRENRGGLARLLSWLLGLELKLRQYRDGKRFSDEIVAAAGVDGLNRAWLAPSSLPTLTELSEPPLWLERVAPAASPAL
jgi:coenzyme F420 biosynthesis associated uncharacterized protein